ncbi:MAG: ATP-dependent DNA helicase [Bacteroidota bacterium]
MPTRYQYNTAFQKAMAGLNAAQRQAVEQTDGPVLVIAGPGTGKTHILSARIGRILLDTDTQAYNVLCLTFTDAGVRAMRERLLQFIGPEAHRVHIFTFHSFCNKIIQDYPARFGAHGLEPVSELEQIELLQNLLNNLDSQHPLRQGRIDAHFYTRHLKDLFQLMKREGWTAKHVQEQIKDYVTDLARRPDFRYQISRGRFVKGELKASKLKAEKDRMRRLYSAAELYPKYVEVLQTARRYDYEDMILWVLRAFQEDEDLLRRYQEQYLYFLVDEYQDTNGAQNALLQQLMDFWDAPNVFIVGDDDQSIYEFQGARLKNLRDFYDRYEQDLRLIILEENYRSSQHILNAAHALIRQNEKRILYNLQSLNVEKRLQAQNPTVKHLEHLPQLVEYPNRWQEIVDIVAQIEHLQAANFPLQEIAIIYAQHRQARDLIRLLEKKQIPYSVKRGINILDLPLIWNLRNLLEYIAAEYAQAYSGEHLLFQLLHTDFFGVAPQDLAIISRYLVKFTREERPKWRDVIQHFENTSEQLEDKLAKPEALQRLATLLNFMIKDYRNFAVPMLVERIVNRSGLLRWVIEQEDKAWQLQVLKRFFDFVEVENERKPRMQVQDLLQTLRRMDDNRIRLEVMKATVSKMGVHLVTAHSAKGLEFEKVFLIDCVEDYWSERQRSGNFQFAMPDTLTYSGEEDSLEARRRLFYVAMTRAKADLRISYSTENAKGKTLQCSQFVEELQRNANIDFTKKSISMEQVLEAQLQLLAEVKPPKITPLNKDTLDALLDGFKLSISSLNLYLRCPLSFFYEYVLKAPTRSSSTGSYGHAMHRAWQRLYETMLLRKSKRFPSERQFIRFFEEEMATLQSHFTAETYTQQLKKGRTHLKHYYQHYLNNWSKNVRVEVAIRHAEVKGVPIAGTIDRLDFKSPRQTQVTDYKVGRVDAAKLRRPTKSKPYGGNYYRQLAFYKLLYENHRLMTPRVDSGEIIFLDPKPSGEFVQEKIELTQQDADFVSDLLQDTYRKIQAHDFHQGCGEANCVWCNFVRQNEALDSLSDSRVEELDD